MMNTITLDFSGIKSYWALHEYFKEVFQLPDYYGRNMDALWDCLRCSFEEDTTIILKNLYFALVTFLFSLDFAGDQEDVSLTLPCTKRCP